MRWDLRWLDAVRRLAPRTVIAMVVASAGFALFANYVLFRGPAMDPIILASHGLLDATLLANALDLAVVVGGILVLAGGARGRELGLVPGSVRRAIATTAAIWLGVNAAAIIADGALGRPLELAAAWRTPTAPLGALLGQLFGNALAEEIEMRGVLFTQLARALADPAPIGRREVIVALVGSQAIFAALHLPNRLAAGLWSGPADAALDLLQLFGIGIGFALIWLRTRNLLVAVGFHALVNAPSPLVAAPPVAVNAALVVAFGVLIAPRASRGARRDGPRR